MGAISGHHPTAVELPGPCSHTTEAIFAKDCHYQPWTITIFKVPDPYTAPFFTSVQYKGYDWIHQQKL